MRRKKKLLKNLMILIIILVVALLFYFIFKPKKSYDTANSNNNESEVIKVTTITEPNIEIELPEEIKDSSNSTAEGKTYTPLIDVSERYLISILSNNEVSILIGDDSSSLLENSTAVEVGMEYMATGISETIEAVYYFTIDDYDYPIFLLLGESGKLYYIDIEYAYSTGDFSISGYIKDLPEVENVYQATVEVDGTTYRSAVITCVDGEGYEFDLDMIGR